MPLKSSCIYCIRDSNLTSYQDKMVSKARGIKRLKANVLKKKRNSRKNSKISKRAEEERLNME